MSLDPCVLDLKAKPVTSWMVVIFLAQALSAGFIGLMGSSTFGYMEKKLWHTRRRPGTLLGESILEKKYPKKKVSLQNDWFSRDKTELPECAIVFFPCPRKSLNGF